MLNRREWLAGLLLAPFVKLKKSKAGLTSKVCLNATCDVIATGYVTDERGRKWRACNPGHKKYIVLIGTDITCGEDKTTWHVIQRYRVMTEEDAIRWDMEHRGLYPPNQNKEG